MWEVFLFYPFHNPRNQLKHVRSGACFWPTGGHCSSSSRRTRQVDLPETALVGDILPLVEDRAQKRMRRAMVVVLWFGLGPTGAEGNHPFKWVSPTWTLKPSCCGCHSLVKANRPDLIFWFLFGHFERPPKG